MEIIEKLEHRFGNLIAALDGQNADAIIDAAAAIRPLVAEVEAQGAWHRNDNSKNRLIHLAKLIDASRFRVNMLTDLSKQRAQNLTHALNANHPAIYRRPNKA